MSSEWSILVGVLAAALWGCSTAPPLSDSKAVGNQISKTTGHDLSRDVFRLEGVFSTPGDVAERTGTVLQLKNGQFRYWFFSEETSPQFGVRYPIEGPYVYDDKTVELRTRSIDRRNWRAEVVNGTIVLIRSDLYPDWRDRRELDYAGVLIHVPFGDPNREDFQRPSVGDILE